MGGWMGGAFFGDSPNYHYFVNDLGQLHASLKKILEFKPAILYVGHGGPLKFENVLERFSSVI